MGTARPPQILGAVYAPDHVRNTGITRAALIPVEQRVTFKLCVLMHLIHTGRSPSYLSDLVTPTSSIATRSRLRSGSSQRYEQPSTRLKLGERSFTFSGPAAWNSLPSSLHEITNYDSFKRQLKTVLFERAYINFQPFFAPCYAPLVT